MGSSASVPAGDDDQAYASAEVDIKLLQQELKEMFSFKILCLGAGESGKSTVVKQLKLIHHTKMDEEELNLTRSALHQNVVDSIKAVVAAAQSFGYTDFAPEHLSTIDMLNEHEESTRLTLNEGAAILELFNSPPIQRAYDRRSEFWLLDSFPYYMKHVERFCDPDFEPTEEDSVMARIRTTGIVTSELEHRITKQDEDDPEHIYFEVVDVGGQRNERKKWIHCFSNVRAILFIVNLAGYHQVLFEDSTKNRMVEEMELFEQITHKDVFKDTPIFLFFNKKDLFETTVPHHPLSETFPEYTGPNEMAPCLQYFEESFKRLLPDDKTVHIMSISARWKRDVKNAFEDVKKQLYDSNRPTLLARSKEIKTNIKKLQSKAGIKSSVAGGENSSGSSTTPLIGDRVGCGISWFRRTEVSS